MKINVLGTDYEFIVANDEDVIKNMEDIDGLCNVFDKEIVVRDAKYVATDASSASGKLNAMDTVLRHEIVHAVMYESGFGAYDDEDLVDWIARMIPKIELIFDKIKHEVKKEEENP